MTKLQIDYLTAQEAKRANQAREALTAQQNAEMERSNRARETETNRSNLVNENIKDRSLQETQRSNYANEILKSDSNAVARYAADQSYRTNHEANIIRADELRERGRSNRVNERIAQQNADTNLFNANINSSALSNQIVHNTSTRQETAKHNRKMEEIEQAKAGLQAASGFAKSISDVIRTFAPLIGK